MDNRPFNVYAETIAPVYLAMGYGINAAIIILKGQSIADVYAERRATGIGILPMVAYCRIGYDQYITYTLAAYIASSQVKRANVPGYRVIGCHFRFC
jgi:hypothetical protein